jgi:hypothetical protein
MHALNHGRTNVSVAQQLLTVARSMDCPDPTRFSTRLQCLKGIFDQFRIGSVISHRRLICEPNTWPILDNGVE